MLAVITVRLPITDYGGPYTLVGQHQNGENIAYFAVDVRKEGEVEARWEEIPIPLPIQYSEELATTVRDTVLSMGYEIVSSEITVH